MNPLTPNPPQQLQQQITVLLDTNTSLRDAYASAIAANDLLSAQLADLAVRNVQLEKEIDYLHEAL